MDKKAIAVYNPSNILEREIQESYHRASGEWLGVHPCQLAAKAVSSLKSMDNWLENVKLLRDRVSYFFAPYMQKKKDTMVFLTYPLFLRDILENTEINSYLHGPITFVTRPLAHYLFREYPIHLYVSTSPLKGYNDVTWFDIGGLLIADETDDVSLEMKAITHVVTQNSAYAHLVDDIMEEVTAIREPFSKVAVSRIGPGVFKLDRHEREIFPDQIVWDKKNREKAVVTRIEPGETGLVALLLHNGDNVTLPKNLFDEQYIAT